MSGNYQKKFLFKALIISPWFTNIKTHFRTFTTMILLAGMGTIIFSIFNHIALPPPPPKVCIYTNIHFITNNVSSLLK